MTLAYSNTSAGQNALSEIQKLLRSFGCSKFGSMIDDNEKVLILQFERNGIPVSVKASMAGYAAMWLKENPYNSRRRCTRVEHERKAIEIANTAVYSILRDWVKGQIMAIECGILSFEGAFLGQIMLPNGQTVLERAQHEKLIEYKKDE